MLLLVAGRCLAALPQGAYGQGYSDVVPPGAALPANLVANRCYTTVDSSLAGVDVDSQIHIHSGEDVQRLRSKLVAEIWPGGFPNGVMPASAVQTTSDNAVGNSSGLFKYLSAGKNTELSAEYRLNINVGYGINSIVYLWVPKQSTNRLFLVHDGHSDDSYDGQGNVSVRAIVNPTNLATVKTLLAQHYAVMWVQMPLSGDNLTASSPQVPFSVRCRAGCDRHAEIFRAFTGSSVSPFRFFVDPVIVAVNYAMSIGKYLDISMMGASGGGWTTLLVAAIDPRVAKSASVAGSVPLFLRSGKCGAASVGDAEQQSQRGSLYNDITYFDLYIMAANGANRRHLQVNNQFDRCCFFGISYVPYATYLSEFIVKNHLGSYRFFLDNAFVGHGYNIPLAGTPANVTLETVVLPAFAN